MKKETFIIILCLFIVTSIGIAMKLNTDIEQGKKEIARSQEENDRLLFWKYWESMKGILIYRLPVDQIEISSATGYRTDPMGGTDERLHKGNDFSVRVGTPVYAAMSGVVKEHWYPPDGVIWQGDPLLGGKVVIQHGEDLFTIYGHLSKTYVHEGDYVPMGKKIALSGNTGLSTGPHLHFEIVVNPLWYLNADR